jgi:hypothetical protein
LQPRDLRIGVGQRARPQRCDAQHQRPLPFVDADHRRAAEDHPHPGAGEPRKDQAGDRRGEEQAEQDLARGDRMGEVGRGMHIPVADGAKRIDREEQAVDQRTRHGMLNLARQHCVDRAKDEIDDREGQANQADERWPIHLHGEVIQVGERRWTALPDRPHRAEIDGLRAPSLLHATSSLADLARARRSPAASAHEPCREEHRCPAIAAFPVDPPITTGVSCPCGRRSRA